MNLSEIEKIMNAHEGIHLCPICSTPFSPRHKRQKTCGSEECKKAYHREYVKERNAERRKKDPKAVREYNAKMMRKHRKKQKDLNEREQELRELSERWKKQLELDEKIAEYGHEYGKRSAEKVLANVPKIDVDLGGVSDDRVQSDDE